MKTIKQLEKEIKEERIKLKSVDVKKLNMEEVIKLNDYHEIIMKEREIEILKSILGLIDLKIKEKRKWFKENFPDGNKQGEDFQVKVYEELKTKIQGK